MQLVQMPRDLLTVEQADLPALGVHPDLVDAVAVRCVGDPLAIRSLALLAPRTAGTSAALMVLARRIGAALRDANIRLRDEGGDLQRGRQKLCYLPGASLRAALDADPARRALESEAALFLQDLDAAWIGPASGDPLDQPITTLIASRRRRGLRTFVTADPTTLPTAMHKALRAELDTVTVHGGM